MTVERDKVGMTVTDVEVRDLKLAEDRKKDIGEEVCGEDIAEAKWKGASPCLGWEGQGRLHRALGWCQGQRGAYRNAAAVEKSPCRPVSEASWAPPRSLTSWGPHSGCGISPRDFNY